MEDIDGESVKGSDKSATSRRAPSQAGVKPSFSRPVTAGDDLLADAIPEEEKGEPVGVLITELTEVGREEEGLDAQPIEEDSESDQQEEEEDNSGGELEKAPSPYDEVRRIGETPKLVDPNNEVDIFESQDYDTDLEFDEDDDTEDPSGRTVYTEYCDKLGVIAVSFFLRHIEDREINMRNHGLCLNETKSISKALKTIETVEKLDLSGNWIDKEGAKYVSKMMEDNESILDLGLADNHIGNIGAPSSAKLLGSLHLKRLDLSGNGFDDQVAHLFAEAIEDCKTLNVLDLSHNAFGEVAGEAFGPAIAANDTLDILDLSWNRIRRKGAVAIAKGLKENVRLKTLSVAWNGFGEDGGLALVDAISVNSTLLEVNLSANRITLSVATRLAKVLSVNENLQVIRLADNPITTNGCIALAQSVFNSTTCVVSLLDLSRVSVEFEFLRIKEDLWFQKRVTLLHGSQLRSGNTPDDIGKVAIEPNSKRPQSPIATLKDLSFKKRVSELVDNLMTKDTQSTQHVTPEQMLAAILEVDNSRDKNRVQSAVNNMKKNKDLLIFYGNLVDSAS